MSAGIIILLSALLSCSSKTNLSAPGVATDYNASFYTTANGCRLFVYDYKPTESYHSTIFILSGITGINHTKEQDIIQILSNGQNRVVVIHPRGTGYSEGTRGDIHNFNDFINDFVEVITSDPDYTSKQHKIILYGHSMSTAIALAVASELEHVDGMILINPPYKLKKAKGMSPGFGQYVKYAFYMVFAPHKPIVNMAGDPARIEDPEDRADAESRIGDTLLVSHFSLYYMMQSHKLMKSMARYAESAGYPLLLVYGLKDNVVDKKGCDILFDSWGAEDKEYILIENGAHGRSTILQAQPFIQKWMFEL